MYENVEVVASNLASECFKFLLLSLKIMVCCFKMREKGKTCVFRNESLNRRLLSLKVTRQPTPTKQTNK